MAAEGVGGKRCRLWWPLLEEGRILAAAMVSGGATWPEGLGVESFASGMHARVWKACADLQRARGARGWGIEDVGAALSGRVRMGELVELVELLGRVPRLDVEGDARTVRRAASRRRLAAKCDHWAGRLRYTDEPVDDVIQEAEAELDTLATLAECTRRA